MGTAPSDKISCLILICQKRPGKCWTFQISELYLLQVQWQDLKVQRTMIYLVIFLILFFLVYQVKENVTKNIKNRFLNFCYILLLLHSICYILFLLYFYLNTVLLILRIFGTNLFPWCMKVLRFCCQRFWDFLFVCLFIYFYIA